MVINKNVLPGNTIFANATLRHQVRKMPDVSSTSNNSTFIDHGARMHIE
jgi:hypothetical protein